MLNNIEDINSMPKETVEEKRILKLHGMIQLNLQAVAFNIYYSKKQ